MASLCKRQQCTIERRGFRQELDSWRHKLIHCVGFESILEGLFGPGLAEDLRLFKDCEPEAVSDWSFDENCLFCCLKRDKVKEHLVGLSNRGLNDTPKPLLVKDQIKINRLEKQAEEFLNAVLYRKDIPSFSDPHIPLVAREIMQRMIRQFAAEYTSKSSSSQDSIPDPQSPSDQSLPRPPSPATSPGATVAASAHNQNPVLSKLLMADQDSPLDLTIKKPPAGPTEQDGVLDLSLKKTRHSSSLPAHSPYLSPATTPLKGESLDLRTAKAKDLQSTSTLEQFMAKLCSHHQRQIVDALGFLQTEVKAISSSTSQVSNPVFVNQGATTSSAASSMDTPAWFPISSTPKGYLEVHEMSHVVPGSFAKLENPPETPVTVKTSTNTGPPLDLRASGSGAAKALVSPTVDAEKNRHSDHAPLKMKIMKTSNLADGKKLSCVLTTALIPQPGSLEEKHGISDSSNRAESQSARLSSPAKRHSHAHQARQRDILGHTKDSTIKQFSAYKTFSGFPPDSPRTARKTIRGSSDHRTRDSACRVVTDPDLGHCDIVYIDKPITECLREQRRHMHPRRNARKSTRGHMYVEEMWELKTVRTLADRNERGNYHPNPLPELITLVTPKQMLAKHDGVPLVDMPFAAGCVETPSEQADWEMPGTGDVLEAAGSEHDIIVETSQTDQSQSKEQSTPSSPLTSPTENTETGASTDVGQDTASDSGETVERDLSVEGVVEETAGDSGKTIERDSSEEGVVEESATDSGQIKEGDSSEEGVVEESATDSGRIKEGDLSEEGVVEESATDSGQIKEGDLSEEGVVEESVTDSGQIKEGDLSEAGVVEESVTDSGQIKEGDLSEEGVVEESATDSGQIKEGDLSEEGVVEESATDSGQIKEGDLSEEGVVEESATDSGQKKEGGLSEENVMEESVTDSGQIKEGDLSEEGVVEESATDSGQKREGDLSEDNVMEESPTDSDQTIERDSSQEAVVEDGATDYGRTVEKGLSEESVSQGPLETEEERHEMDEVLNKVNEQVMVTEMGLELLDNEKAEETNPQHVSEEEVKSSQSKQPQEADTLAPAEVNTEEKEADVEEAESIEDWQPGEPQPETQKLPDDSGIVENNNTDEAPAEDIVTAQEVDTVEPVKSDVVSVEMVKSDLVMVETVESDLVSVETVKSDLVSVETVKRDLVMVETVESDLVSVETVKSDLVSVETVKSDLVSVETVESDLVSVETVKSDLVSVETVKRDLVTVETVESDLVSVETVKRDLVSVEPAEGTNNNDDEEEEYDVSTKSLEALLMELPPWRRKRGVVISLPKRLRDTKSVIVGYVNGRPISQSDRSLRRRSFASPPPLKKRPLKSSLKTPKKTDVDVPVENSPSPNHLTEEESSVKPIEDTPVIAQVEDPHPESTPSSASKPSSMSLAKPSKKKSGPSKGKSGPSKRKSGPRAKQTEPQTTAQGMQDTLPAPLEKTVDSPQSHSSKYPLGSARLKQEGTAVSPPPADTAASPVLQRPTTSRSRPSVEGLPSLPISCPPPLDSVSPLPVSSPNISSLPSTAPEQCQQSVVPQSTEESNTVKAPLADTAPRDIQKTEVESKLQAKKRGRSAKVPTEVDKNDTQQVSNEVSSPLQSQGVIKDDMQPQSPPFRSKRLLQKEEEANKFTLQKKPEGSLLDDKASGGESSSSSASDKPARMPLRSESSKADLPTQSNSQTSPADNKILSLRSQSLASPSTSAPNMAEKPRELISPVRMRSEKIIKTPTRSSLSASVVSPPGSTPSTSSKHEPRKQTASKFLEALNGEENQQLITNLNIKFDKMQKGWVQLDKEGQPATKYKNKTDRQAAIWKSKRRTRKPKSLEHQRYSPAQMLFMKNFALSSICRWFFESTETKSLVITKNVNTRHPSETQLCFHSSSGVPGTSQGVFPSLQAERLKKHLKKFAIASPVKSNPRSQKLIAKVLEQEAGVIKGKESKELPTATRIFTKPHGSSVEVLTPVAEPQKASAKSKNPASARILRKYSNIREKMQVQQTSVRLKEASRKSLKVTNATASKSASKSNLKSAVKGQKSPLPVGKRLKESVAKIERRKTSPGRKIPVKPVVQEKTVNTAASSRAARDLVKKDAESLQRSSQRPGTPKTAKDTLVQTSNKKQLEAEKTVVEKPIPPRATPPRATPPRATPPRATPPRATPPRATPPRATPPRATPPRATPPRATPPRATLPRASAKAQTKELSQSRVTPSRATENKGAENAIKTLQQNMDITPTTPAADQVLTRSQRKIEATLPLPGSPDSAPKRASKPTVTQSGTLKSTAKRAREATPTRSGTPKSATRKAQVPTPSRTGTPKSASKKAQEPVPTPAKRTRMSHAK